MEWATELDRRPDRQGDAYRVARSADTQLSRFPPFESESKKRLAQFLKGRALRWAFMERRDEAILWWLKALTYEPDCEPSRRTANGLIDNDYPLLMSTARLKGDDRSLYGAVAISSTSSRLAAGEHDGVVRVWDLDKPGEPELLLRGATTRISGLTFSPDGRLLAAASGESGIRVWDIGRGMLLLVSSRRDFSAIAVAFSNDGRHLAMGGAGDVLVWDLKDTQAPPVSYPRPKGSGVVHALAFSPDGRRLAAGGTGGYVLVWDTSRPGREDATASFKSEGSVFALAFRSDGRLAAGGTDGVLVWDAGQPRAPIFRLRGTHGSVNALAFDPATERLAVGYADGAAQVWFGVLHNGQSSIVLRGSTGNMRAIAFRPDGSLASVDSSGVVRIWKTGETTAQRLKPDEPRPAVLCVAIDHEGGRLACGCEDGEVQIQDFGMTGRDLLRLRGTRAPILSLAFDPRGERLVGGDEEGGVRIWDSRTSDRLLRQLRGARAPILSLAFDKDGRHVAAGDLDGRVRLWDTNRGDDDPVELSRPGGAVFSLVFDPSGPRLACGGGDGVVRIWDLDRPGAPPTEFLGIKGKVFALAYDGRGRRLAAGGDGGETLVWDVERPGARPLGTGRQRSAFYDVAFPGLLDSRRLAFGGIHALAFSPDGTSILAATSEWVHLARLEDSRAVATSSRLLPGRYPPTSATAVRPLDSPSNRLRVAVIQTPDTLLPTELDFDNSVVIPIQGDAEGLLADWQKRLDIDIDENGEMISNKNLLK